MDEPRGLRRRALLIASGQYTDPGLSQLRAPTGDVRAFEEVLADPAIGGFETDRLVNAGTEAIKERIEGFFDEATLLELLLLYISGHGVLRGDRLYFATRNTRLDRIRATSVEDTFVHDLVRHSRAQTVVLVLDCCHSGAFGAGLAPRGELTVSMERRFVGEGRVTLTASNALEYAFEERADDTRITELQAHEPGSVFTQCLVEGLRTGEADTNEDGAVSIDELYGYVLARMKERASAQTPSLTGDQHGEIVVAASTRVGGVLDPEVLRAAESVLAEVRLGAVALLEQLARKGGKTSMAATQVLERLSTDDSQRVAAAAAAALGSVRSPPPPPPPPPPPRPGSRRRRLLAVAGVAALAVSVAVVVVVATRGHGAAGPFDFYHDGHDTLVLSSLGTGVTSGGFVRVYRSLDDEMPRELSDRSTGASKDENFGSALASGDFDGDHNADLAIGVRDDDRVSVVYGTSSGLSSRPREELRASVDGDGHRVGKYGAALAAADFNGDGFTDLAVGAPGADGDAGVAEILFGRRGGLTKGGSRWLSAPSGSRPHFGNRLAVGDVNGDRRPDLFEGSQDSRGTVGHASFCPGAPRGPSTCRTLGDGGTSALAVTDVNGDRVGDLVQGDSAGPQGHASGEVHVWLGGGAFPSGHMVIDESELGIRRLSPTPRDGFGAVVVAGHIDHDRFGDIVVGAPGAAEGAGRVFVIRGGASGPARGGNVAIPSARVRVPQMRRLRAFGRTVSLLHLEDERQLDLAVALKPQGTLQDAVVVLPDLRAVLHGAPATAVDVPALQTVDAAGSGRIRLARPPTN